MLSVNRLRRFALVALALFAFAQGAVAAMGCATLRVDNGRAVMPSGEPCDMLPDQPGLLGIKHCVHDDGQTSQSASALDHPSLRLIAFVAPLDVSAPVTFAHGFDAGRILGPPPFRQTQRLRI